MWPTEHELGYMTVSICDFLVLFLLDDGKFTSVLPFDKATGKFLFYESFDSIYLLRGDPKLRNSWVDRVGENL